MKNIPDIKVTKKQIKKIKIVIVLTKTPTILIKILTTKVDKISFRSKTFSYSSDNFFHGEKKVLNKIDIEKK